MKASAFVTISLLLLALIPLAAAEVSVEEDGDYYVFEKGNIKERAPKALIDKFDNNAFKNPEYLEIKQDDDGRTKLIHQTDYAWPSTPQRHLEIRTPNENHNTYDLFEISAFNVNAQDIANPNTILPYELALTHKYKFSKDQPDQFIEATYDTWSTHPTMLSINSEKTIKLPSEIKDIDDVELLDDGAIKPTQIAREKNPDLPLQYVPIGGGYISLSGVDTSKISEAKIGDLQIDSGSSEPLTVKKEHLEISDSGEVSIKDDFVHLYNIENGIISPVLMPLNSPPQQFIDNQKEVIKQNLEYDEGSKLYIIKESDDDEFLQYLNNEVSQGVLPVEDVKNVILDFYKEQQQKGALPQTINVNDKQWPVEIFDNFVVSNDDGTYKWDNSKFEQINFKDNNEVIVQATDGYTYKFTRTGLDQSDYVSLAYDESKKSVKFRGADDPDYELFDIPSDMVFNSITQSNLKGLKNIKKTDNGFVIDRPGYLDGNELHFSYVDGEGNVYDNTDSEQNDYYFNTIRVETEDGVTTTKYEIVVDNDNPTINFEEVDYGSVNYILFHRIDVTDPLNREDVVQIKDPNSNTIKRIKYDEFDKAFGENINQIDQEILFTVVNEYENKMNDVSLKEDGVVKIHIDDLKQTKIYRKDDSDSPMVTQTDTYDNNGKLISSRREYSTKTADGTVIKVLEFCNADDCDRDSTNWQKFPKNKEDCNGNDRCVEAWEQHDLDVRGFDHILGGFREFQAFMVSAGELIDKFTSTAIAGSTMFNWMSGWFKGEDQADWYGVQSWLDEEIYSNIYFTDQAISRRCMENLYEKKDTQGSVAFTYTNEPSIGVDARRGGRQVIRDPFGELVESAYIVAERSEPITYPNGTTMYFMKITWMLAGVNEDSTKFKLRLIPSQGADVIVPNLFFIVEKGQTLRRTGEDAIMDYTEKRYTHVCFVFADPDHAEKYKFGPDGDKMNCVPVVESNRGYDNFNFANYEIDGIKPFGIEPADPEPVQGGDSSDGSDDNNWDQEVDI